MRRTPHGRRPSRIGPALDPSSLRIAHIFVPSTSNGRGVAQKVPESVVGCALRSAYGRVALSRSRSRRCGTPVTSRRSAPRKRCIRSTPQANASMKAVVGREACILEPEAEDREGGGRSLEPAVEPGDESVAPQDWERVVAELALRRRRVHLPDVVEVEQRRGSLAGADRVERREEGRLLDRRWSRAVATTAGTRPRSTVAMSAASSASAQRTPRQPSTSISIRPPSRTALSRHATTACRSPLWYMRVRAGQR